MSSGTDAAIAVAEALPWGDLIGEFTNIIKDLIATWAQNGIEAAKTHAQASLDGLRTARTQGATAKAAWQKANDALVDTLPK